MNILNDTSDLIRLTIDSLPTLTSQDLPDTEDSCPICLTAFSSIFLDTDPDAGVTKLVACNHIFCRKDLAQWIMSLHGNCPTCRHVFLDIRPPSESDDESSDGGEYQPEDDYDLENDFEDDEGFIDTSDGFSDAFDYLAEDMEMDAEEEWGDEVTDVDADMEDAIDDMEDEAAWGLTDGESSYMSEGADDAALESEDGGTDTRVEIGVTLSVHGDAEAEGNVHIEPGQEEK
ncbi:hypothetical protein FPV67DRAFT_1776870 [Lyophyllum atratum]|nr:hypothetical protein FPV67DRAFT_1776870 [Lyophyllum atratum]